MPTCQKQAASTVPLTNRGLQVRHSPQRRPTIFAIHEGRKIMCLSWPVAHWTKTWTKYDNVNYCKPPVEKMIRSGIVYKITCPRCTACYVGQSSRHLQTRIREHTKNPGPVKTHLRNCNTTITEEHIDILASTSRGEGYLLTLEALFIQELEPKINTKDEWRSRTLAIKI